MLPQETKIYTTENFISDYPPPHSPFIPKIQPKKRETRIIMEETKGLWLFEWKKGEK